MSEMVMSVSALPKIFFEIFPQGNVLVHIDGEIMTLQPAKPLAEAKKKFPLIGMLADLSLPDGELASESFARRKAEEKELEL